MNVFGTVRRVVGKFPLMQEEDEAEADEINLSRKTIMHESKIFLNPNSHADFMEKAIEVLGHAAYIGGSENNDIICPIIPDVLEVVANKTETIALRLQCLRSLAEMCHFNKGAIDKVWKSTKFWKLIPEVVGELDQPLISRWACKWLTTMLAHSMSFLKDLPRIPNLMSALQMASQYDHDWRGFGCDHASLALALAGKITLRDYERRESQLKKRQRSRQDINIPNQSSVHNVNA